MSSHSVLKSHRVKPSMGSRMAPLSPPAWHRYFHPHGTAITTRMAPLSPGSAETELIVPETKEAVTGASRSNQFNKPQTHAPPLLPPPFWLHPRRLEPPPKLAPLVPFRTACCSEEAPAGGMPGQDCLMLGGPAAPACETAASALVNSPWAGSRMYSPPCSTCGGVSEREAHSKARGPASYLGCLVSIRLPRGALNTARLQTLTCDSSDPIRSKRCCGGGRTPGI